MGRRALAAVALASLVVAACSGDDERADHSTGGDTASPDFTSSSQASGDIDGSGGDPPNDSGDDRGDDGIDATVVPPISAPGTTLPPLPAVFDVIPGTEQITVTGAAPGTALEFVDEAGQVVAAAFVDANGAVVQRALPGGAVLRVRDATSESEPVTVMARTDTPQPAFYAEQRLPTDGLGYITTRDGTTLSASVWLPGPADAGPYPTVVEYSGYSPSDPDSEGFPDILTALGYAYVGVNVRGTGCSGGSFRYFEHAQSLDGYDAIEVVAAQPWVLGHRAGMVGVSYPGISQLFVAATRPPSLAAITPFSVIADSAISVLYPGGILNTGFAVAWIEQRMREARPEGQQWAADRIAGGDETCAANQMLRLQNPDLLAELRANPFWSDELAAEIAPRLFVDRITVPTFIAGAWQDEQTGGHFATMLDRFTGTEHFYASLVNGLHTESISPTVFARLVEFLDLYVAERTPSLDVARTIAPQLGDAVFGTSEVALPASDRFAGMTHAAALAVFEAEPPIQVLFEQGAAEGHPPRAPMPRWVESFEAWPVPEAVATAWQLDVDTGRPGSGGLRDPNIEAGDLQPAQVDYLALPDAVPPTFYSGSSDGVWSVDVDYDWVEGGPGTFASFVTQPLGSDIVVVGSGSVDLMLRSNLGDTDVEVTISEVRPDGQEMYVQSGWLRASQRALDESASTDLRPVHTHLETDAAPLPADEFALVRVELFPFAHAFRAGSRIRLTVDAPGGNRAVWEFDTIAGGERVTIATGGRPDDTPSQLVLPVVPGMSVPNDYPECGALRGQPCRPYAST